jgi:hypothetical protein
VLANSDELEESDVPVFPVECVKVYGLEIYSDRERLVISVTHGDLFYYVELLCVCRLEVARKIF